jgi:peroxiredoxin
MTLERRFLKPGDPAPDFVLPAANRDGYVALADYRGRSPLLLGLFRGLHCPFCRRQVVQLATTHDKLKAVGIQTLAVVNTQIERARLYFDYRPTRVLIAADPDAATHRAFCVPAGEFVTDPADSEWPWRATMQQFQETLINSTGELPSPLNPFEANVALNEKDGFQLTAVDEQILAAHATQLAGHFLIDTQGIIRWAHVEAEHRVADLTKFPSGEEILAAAASLPR